MFKNDLHPCFELLDSGTVDLLVTRGKKQSDNMMVLMAFEF
jgi:hypothetical protein